MENDKQITFLIRRIETEKLKFAIGVLTDLKSKKRSKEFKAIIDSEISILQKQLDMDLKNLD